jgi:hypothetical protein
MTEFKVLICDGFAMIYWHFYLMKARADYLDEAFDMVG